MKIRTIFKKIKKIIQYIPILWKDEDWDFEYILILLKFKLNRIKNTIYQNNIIAKHEQRNIFIGINKTISHIDNYIRDIDAFEEIYGELPFEISFKTEKCGNGRYSQIMLNKNTQKPLTEEEKNLYYDYVLKATEFQQKEWELMFDTIKQEGQKWWE